MHALSSTDPLAWLLVSYLVGSVVCGVWTLGLRALSAALGRAESRVAIKVSRLQ